MMVSSRFLRTLLVTGALFALVLCSCTLSGTPDTSSSEPGDTPRLENYSEIPLPPSTPSTLQSYFYTTPRGEGPSPQEVATYADIIILTRGDEAFRDQIRAAGYQGTILQYVLSNEAEGPAGATSVSAPCTMTYQPWPNQVSYGKEDFCRFVHPNEEWFLHNSAGERLYGNIHRVFYLMNPASIGWRSFVIARLRQALEGDATHPPVGYDGLFLDNVHLSLYAVKERLANSDGTVQEFASEEEYRAAWVSFLQDISDALRPRWPVWANLIADPVDGTSWNLYLNYLDGVLNEEFATGWAWAGSSYSPEAWDANLKQVEHTLSLGKKCLLVSQGANDTLQPFALASYLLVTDENNTFFRYSIRARYEEWRQYPNYLLDLGEPLGPRFQQADDVWRRNFRKGYVVVNPKARTGDIVLDR